MNRPTMAAVNKHDGQTAVNKHADEWTHHDVVHDILRHKAQHCGEGEGSQQPEDVHDG
jgi:hypothetical protein